MPIGGGIIPASGSQQYTELTYVTRRAFIPKMVVQIYNSTPLMAALIANSQTASGGVSSVTVPVQGSQFVNAQWSDYSGSFAQPSVQQGAYNAEFNLKLLVSPVPFLGMEGAVQQDYAIIPLIEARMNDATNVMMDAMATSLYNNTSDTQQLRACPSLLTRLAPTVALAVVLIRGGLPRNTLLDRLTRLVRTYSNTSLVPSRTVQKCRHSVSAVLVLGHCWLRTT